MAKNTMLLPKDFFLETVPQESESDGRLDPATMATAMGVPHRAAERFIATYVRVLSERRQEFRELLASESWGELGALAHRLKSSASSVGAERLAAALLEIEEQSQASSRDLNALGASVERADALALALIEANPPSEQGGQNG